MRVHVAARVPAPYTCAFPRHILALLMDTEDDKYIQETANMLESMMGNGVGAQYVYGVRTPPHCRDSDETGVIRPNAVVEIVGLRARSDLNGQTARVERYSLDAGRWEVHLDTGPGIRCKPGNMRVKTKQPADVVTADRYLEQITPPGTRYRPRLSMPDGSARYEDPEHDARYMQDEASKCELHFAKQNAETAEPPAERSGFVVGVEWKQGDAVRLAVQPTCEATVQRRAEDGRYLVCVGKKTSLLKPEELLRATVWSEDEDPCEVLAVGRSFWVPRAVLAIGSDMLRAKFSSGMADAGALQISVEPISATSFEAILAFFYTGVTRAADQDELLALLQASAQLQALELSAAICRALKGTLSSESGWAVWELADGLALPELLEDVENYYGNAFFGFPRPRAEIVHLMGGRLSHAGVQLCGTQYFRTACYSGDDEWSGECVSAGFCAAVVAAMRAHSANRRVVEAACDAFKCCAGFNDYDRSHEARLDARRAALVEAGVAMALAEAIVAHPDDHEIAATACEALGKLCGGHTSQAALARSAAADARAIEAVAAAMRAHPLEHAVQRYGCVALRYICAGADAAAEGRRQAAVDADAVALVTAAMRVKEYPPKVDVYPHGRFESQIDWHALNAGRAAACGALGNLLKDCETAEARRAAVETHDVCEAILQSMDTRAPNESNESWHFALLQRDGCSALARICAGSPACKRATVDAGGMHGLQAVLRHAMGAISAFERKEEESFLGGDPEDVAIWAVAREAARSLQQSLVADDPTNRAQDKAYSKKVTALQRAAARTRRMYGESSRDFGRSMAYFGWADI